MSSILNHALSDRQAGNPNLIVDGDFRFWFEGTSQITNGYGSDTMWTNDHSGPTKTHSRQKFVDGQSEVPNASGYFSRTEFTEPPTKAAGDYCLKAHTIEGVRTFAGKRAILSFWAKSDAARNIAVEFWQSFGSGGTPSALVTSIGVTTVALTAAWQKHEVVVDLPSIEGKTLGTDGNDFLRFAFWFMGGSSYDARNNSLGYQSGTVDIARVKLEEGSVATDGGWRNEAEELALVNRYYKYFDQLFLLHYGTPAASKAIVDLRPYWESGIMRAEPSVSCNSIQGGNSQTTRADYISATQDSSSAVSVIDLVIDARL